MSNINPYNIDGTFPVANQDNSSQGFRDNFTNIKYNFVAAQNEINDLQSKAVLTSALQGQTINNNMNGTKLIGPQLNAWTQSLIDQGVQTIGSTVTLDFTIGNFQKITTGGPAGTPGIINIAFANWPAATGNSGLGYASMRVWFVVQSNLHQIQLPSSVDIADTSLTNYNGSGLLSFDVPGNYIFDFSSINGGENYLINDLTRNRAWFTDPYFYYNPTVNPSLLIGYGNLLPLSFAVESSAFDAISARGSFASYQSYQDFDPPGFGDGDSSTAGGSSVRTPGYGVYTSRSRVDPTQGPLIKATDANDPIGYFNASFASGSPGIIGNTVLPEAGTFRFYANSVLPSSITSVPDGIGGLTSNYSPGGNIQIWTKQDFGLYGAQTLGYAGWPRADSVNAGVNAFYSNLGGVLGLAVTIENDQSVKTWAATAKNYQFANLSAIAGAVNVNVSPYISTVILDSLNGVTVVEANLTLGPNVAFQDGQELSVTSNCTITTLNILPFTGNLTIPVIKLGAQAVCSDGANVTYYFDNSGNYFPMGSYFQAVGFADSTHNSSGALITNSNVVSITANLIAANVTTGDIGSVISSTTIAASSSFAKPVTTIASGTSLKFIYVANQSKWYQV
jgi:hypothetical protein